MSIKLRSFVLRSMVYKTHQSPLPRAVISAEMYARCVVLMFVSVIFGVIIYGNCMYKCAVSASSCLPHYCFIALFLYLLRQIKMTMMMTVMMMVTICVETRRRHFHCAVKRTRRDDRRLTFSSHRPTPGRPDASTVGLYIYSSLICCLTYNTELIS